MLVSKYPPTHALRRPLIYVYDLPPEYVTRMLQYKVHRQACVYRLWGESNNLEVQHFNLYGVETYLHEMLLQSEHRCGYYCRASTGSIFVAEHRSGHVVRRIS